MKWSTGIVNYVLVSQALKMGNIYTHFCNIHIHICIIQYIYIILMGNIHIYVHIPFPGYKTEDLNSTELSQMLKNYIIYTVATVNSNEVSLSPTVLEK